MTLTRAMEGIIEMLRQSHGERRERVLEKLMVRLDSQGFSTGSFRTGRRSA